MESLLSSSLLLYLIPSIVAFIAISVIVGSLIYFRRRAPKSVSTHHAFSHHATFVNVASKQRHSIDTIPWRIGRSRTNGLSIDDHSVSRVHAEVNLDEDGKFHICDLESLNGVYVNEERIDISILNDGDIVDVGDIRFRFDCEDNNKQ